MIKRKASYEEGKLKNYFLAMANSRFAIECIGPLPMANDFSPYVEVPHPCKKQKYSLVLLYTVTITEDFCLLTLQLATKLVIYSLLWGF